MFDFSLRILFGLKKKQEKIYYLKSKRNRNYTYNYIVNRFKNGHYKKTHLALKSLLHNKYKTSDAKKQP